MPSVCDARLHDKLTRAEMAKIAAQYLATHIPERQPNLNKICTNFLGSIEGYKNLDLYNYMVQSCKYEVMGIHTTTYEAIPDFMPGKFVSRAEF